MRSKKKVALLMVTALLVCSVSLFATPANEVSTTSSGSGEPQYGGTLTVSQGFGEAATADMSLSQWPTVYYTNPVIDFLIIGDFEKYDARGTNEFPFWVSYTVPEEFTRGNLVESWEVTPDKIVYHIRPGVRWAADGKEHVMESREYTAYDTAYSLNRYMENPAGQSMLAPGGWITSITATDKYTCVIETNFFEAGWKWKISTGWGNGQYAKESVEAGLSDWNNLVGTGPWMLKEYVLGSAFTYEKNPDFWDTTIINGKEYEIPFIDELHFPIILDASTRLAAFRTGKLDYNSGMSPRDKDTMVKSNSDLIALPVTSYHSDFISLRMNDRTAVDDGYTYQPTEILGNQKIRQALMIGLDRQYIMEAELGEGDIYGWPINGDFSTVTTPVNEMPASTQELFEYDPAKAKQMIADAGYPDGFSLKMILNPEQSDLASLIVDMWSEIGVETEMAMMETVAWQAMEQSQTGYDVMIAGEPTSDPIVTYNAVYVGGKGQSNYYDEELDATFAAASKNPDADARAKVFKEMQLKVLDATSVIPLASGRTYALYWPWVNNYYGIVDESAWGTSHMNARIWIDQDLKTEMGH